MEIRSLSVLVLLASCSAETSPIQADASRVASHPDEAPWPSALLPEAGDWSPSIATLPSQGPVDGAYLADVESCGGCHPDVLAQQQASAHAFASFNNPVYRFSVEALREKVGRQASRACAGCHDVALLVDGAMAEEVLASDLRAHNGVSCRLCHGISTATHEGNGSYTLEPTQLPLPVTDDAQSLVTHRDAARPPALATLCGSCHQSFLSPATGNRDVLAGQNELLAWSDSAYAGAGTARIDSVESKTCVQCHMAKVAAPLNDVAADGAGQISSHYFLGAHTWLAAMRGDDEQLARAQSFLEGVATIDAISQHAESGEVRLDVVVRNTGVGHRFPSGVRDAANTWLEVEVLGPSGKVVLGSRGGEDAHRLAALVADEEGVVLERRETHRFAALIADHTIAPRDVALTRYRGVLPPGAIADSVRVKLLHQSRGAELARAACAESKSERGQAYRTARRSLGRAPLDGCAAQPVTTIAVVTRAIGDQGMESFTRSYEHGLGLLHEVQERVEEARPSLQHALRLSKGKPRERAMALVALAELEGRQGRAEQALRLLDEAEALLPTSATIFARKGDVLSRVWRWPLAAEAYAEAVKQVDGNASLWRRYALALGSSGLQRDALLAAQRGLRLLPRDPDLLRAQAIALRSLEADDAEEAMEVYLEHRGPDNIGSTRLRCATRSTLCARESLPVHEHVLAPASSR